MKRLDAKTRRWKGLVSTFAVAGLALAFSPRLSAASLLLTGATVHTVSGDTLAPGQVLIQDGKVAAVGSSVSAPNVATLDLHGQHLYPGLILLDSILGLTEIEAVRSTADSTEVGDYTPDVESWVAVNPDSELLPVSRANGIAYFEPVPKGGIVAGQSGLVAMEGWTSEQRALKKPIALHLFWPSQELEWGARARGRARTKPKSLTEQAKERRTKQQAMMEFFEEARAYGKAKAAGGQAGTSPPPLVPAWEAMLPYVRGELPIVVHADDTRQIKAAVNWATTNHFRMILADGRDAWMLAELLATSHIPVVYAHTYTQPTRDTEPYDVHFTAPEVLHRAGVEVTFTIGLSPMAAANARNLPYAAAQAVAFGLPEAEALKGMTLYPARLAGVAHRLGSIEPGKDATLFAANGNIFDIRSNVTHLWLDGKEVSLGNRHTRLYEKYRNRPKPE